MASAGELTFSASPLLTVESLRRNFTSQTLCFLIYKRKVLADSLEGPSSTNNLKFWDNDPRQSSSAIWVKQKCRRSIALFTEHQNFKLTRDRTAFLALLYLDIWENWCPERWSDRDSLQSRCGSLIYYMFIKNAMSFWKLQWFKQ